MRVYLNEGGLLVFGSQLKAPSGGARVTPVTTEDYIVNHWGEKRDAAPLWTMSELEQYLDHVHAGPGTFRRLWESIKKTLGRVLVCLVLHRGDGYLEFCIRGTMHALCMCIKPASLYCLRKRWRSRRCGGRHVRDRDCVLLHRDCCLCPHTGVAGVHRHCAGCW